MTRSTLDTPAPAAATPAPADALATAQAHVARLTAERTACAAAYRAAVARGDGPAMVALRRQSADLEELVAGAEVAVLAAEVAHLRTEGERLDAALGAAQQGEAHARTALAAAVAPTWTQEEWACGRARRTPESRQAETEATRALQEVQEQSGRLHRQRQTVRANLERAQTHLEHTIAHHQQRLG